MNIYDLIYKRRTIRKFKQQPISYDILEKLVNAARVAPSASNLQPCEYLVVSKKDLLEKIFSALKWAGYIAPAGDPPQGERPMAYIIILINSKIRKNGGEVDAAAAIENMILTALDYGIGSCWLYSVERKYIRSLFKIPKGYLINSILALGYPNESPIMEEIKDTIEYWKDDKNVLHVPKRKLKDIMHLDTF